MNQTEIFTTAISILATLISLLSYFNSKRLTTTGSITKNRMEWIKEVRKYCSDFLVEFDQESPDITVLKDIYIKIQLYGYGNVYMDFFESLKCGVEFIESNIGVTNYQEKNKISQEIMKNSQEILNGVWWRMKREGRISIIRDKFVSCMYNRRYNKNKH